MTALKNAKTAEEHIDEREALAAWEKFRALPDDKRAVVIAFMQGMECQASIMQIYQQ